MGSEGGEGWREGGRERWEMREGEVGNEGGREGRREGEVGSKGRGRSMEERRVRGGEVTIEREK